MFGTRLHSLCFNSNRNYVIAMESAKSVEPMFLLIMYKITLELKIRELLSKYFLAIFEASPHHFMKMLPKYFLFHTHRRISLLLLVFMIYRYVSTKYLSVLSCRTPLHCRSLIKVYKKQLFSIISLASSYFLLDFTTLFTRQF